MFAILTMSATPAVFVAHFQPQPYQTQNKTETNTQMAAKLPNLSKPPSRKPTKKRVSATTKYDPSTSLRRDDATDAIQGLLHPLDETSVPYRAVAALFAQWTLSRVGGYGLPAVPPLVPMVLHALTGIEQALVFAAARGGPQFAVLSRKWTWKNATLVEALCASISHNHAQHVQTLFRRSIDINQRFLGHTPLWYAAQLGNPEIMRQLLCRFPNIDPDALNVAVANGHSECADMLLKVGAQPLQQHAVMAVGRRNERLLRLLLCYGVTADVEILKKALDQDALCFLPIIAECITNTTVLMMALEAQDGQMVQALLETLSDAQLRIDYGVRTTQSDTALSLAVRWGNVAVVQALLVRGATPTAAVRAQLQSQPDSISGRAISRLLSGPSLQLLQVFPEVLMVPLLITQHAGSEAPTPLQIAAAVGTETLRQETRTQYPVCPSDGRLLSTGFFYHRVWCFVRAAFSMW
jgi:ankyrin repeat protein